MTTDQTARTIRAPWTPEQVSALNRFQQYGGMHPFTCGNDHHSVHVVLMAHQDGWHCSDPACDYRQDWAHAFMAVPAAVSAPVQPPATRADVLREQVAAYRSPGTRTLYCVVCARQEEGWQPVTAAEVQAGTVCDFCGGRVLAVAARTLGHVVASYVRGEEDEAVLPPADRATVCICGHTEQQHFEDACITELTGCQCGDYLPPDAAREVIARWREAATQARTDRAAVLNVAAQRLYTALFPAVYADMGQKAAEGVNRAVSELRRMADEEQPAAEARQARCPSCDHKREFHDADGRCWFTVDHGVPGSNLVCPCAPRRGHDEMQQGEEPPESACTCGVAGDGFVPLGHYADCPEAQQDEVCGKTVGVSGNEYPPCARRPNHPEAYCRSADGNAYFLAADEARP